MNKNDGASGKPDRATQASPEAPAGLRHPVSVPSAADAVLPNLKRPDRSFLFSLPEQPGHYAVGVLRGVSRSSVVRLRTNKLIDEQWTWASGATPDCGITPLGVEVRALLRKERRSCRPRQTRR